MTNQGEGPERFDVSVEGHLSDASKKEWELSDASKKRIRQALQRTLHAELAKENPTLGQVPGRGGIFIGFDRT
jgi:hypothetical protein